MNENETIQAALAIIESRLQQTEGVIRNENDARHFVTLKLGDRQAEVFAAMFLNNRHSVIEFREMFFGTIDGTSVYPREVVKAALEVNAAAVIFAHNHPSGIAEPSNADILITERLTKALGLIDIRVLDHFVVGGTTVTSFAERGLI